MEKTRWTIRSFRNGDEADILRLINHIFGAGRGIEYWNWEFKNNQYSKPIISVAVDETQNKLIGHIALLPVLLNFVGSPILICQAIELFVHPDYRNQGIFGALARHCHNQCISSGIKMVYGFPNEYAFPGWVSKQNWKRIFFLRRYVKSLCLRGGIETILKFEIVKTLAKFIYCVCLQLLLSIKRYGLKRKMDTTLTFIWSDTVPDNYDSLWNYIKSFEILSIRKDSKYLKWRYEQKPGYQYKYFYLMDGIDIIAFCVVNVKDKTATICEFILKERNLLAGQYLINELESYYLRRGYKSMIFVGNDSGVFECVFKDFKLDPGSSLVLCGRVFDDSALAEYFPFPSNWTITLGDTDLI